MKTSEELKSLKEEVKPLKKNLAELRQVAGGKPIDQRRTRMLCFSPECGYTVLWTGDFYKKVFECPHCHQMSLEGVETIK